MIFFLTLIVLVASASSFFFGRLHVIEERRDRHVAAIWDALSLYEQDFGRLPASLVDLKSV